MSFTNRARLGDVTASTPTTTTSSQSSAQQAAQFAAVASTAQKIINSIESIFDPGAARDAQRLARANYFRDAADLGSVTAARYILGGLVNTSGNERPYYTAAENTVQTTRPDVMTAAIADGALWAVGIPDPGGTQSMVNAVKADLVALQEPALAFPINATGAGPATSAPPATTTTAHPPVVLPGMTTTAGYNYLPWIFGGAIVVLAVILKRER